MAPRRFTPEEADSLLPRLTAIMVEMQELKRQHDRMKRKVRELQQRMGSNGHVLEEELNSARRGMTQASEQVSRLMETIEALGCELKGIDQGLVDFRAEMEGRDVYLCWRLGEPRLAWWHELETGFAGRRPLPDRT